MPLDFSDFNKKKANNPVLDTTGFDNPDAPEEPGIGNHTPAPVPTTWSGSAPSGVIDFSDFNKKATSSKNKSALEQLNAIEPIVTGKQIGRAHV